MADTTKVAKFLDGRLLIQESKAAETVYSAGSSSTVFTGGGGLKFRIGEVRHIERIVSVATNFAKDGLVCNLGEATISGHNIHLVMRRGDAAGFLSGDVLSSMPTVYGRASGLLSGLVWMGELLSGAPISGLVTITANVIGY